MQTQGNIWLLLAIRVSSQTMKQNQPIQFRAEFTIELEPRMQETDTGNEQNG